MSGIISVIIIIAGLVVGNAEDENFQWVNASKQQLLDNYFEYERCVLDNVWDFKPLEGLYNQKRCKEYFPSLKSSIPSRCWLGAMQQKMDFGMCLRDDWVCHTLPERLGYWKVWSSATNIESAFRATGNAERLLQTARKAGFNIVKFLGDSMAIQLAHHIGCGLHRSNTSSMNYMSGVEQFYNMNTHACAMHQSSDNQKSAFLCMERAPVSVGAFNHSSKQFRLPRPASCNDEECHINFALNYIAKSYDKVLAIGKKFKRSLLIMPLPIAKKLDVEMEEYCKAIYRNAKLLAAREIRILIVTPFTQHFGHARGIFIKTAKNTSNTATSPTAGSLMVDGIPVRSISKRSCQPLKGPFPLAEHPDSISFRKYMDKLFPSWRKLIGYYDATAPTIPFWDMHPEMRVTGFISDCTHLAYSPFALEYLWYDIGKYVQSSYENAKLKTDKKKDY